MRGERKYCLQHGVFCQGLFLGLAEGKLLIELIGIGHVRVRGFVVPIRGISRWIFGFSVCCWIGMLRSMALMYGIDICWMIYLGITILCCVHQL